MSIPSRDEILRIDCAACNGNGYVTRAGGEEPCKICGGVGMREKKVPWKPEGYSAQEIAGIFGVQHFTRRPDKDDPAFDRTNIN